MIPFPSRRSFVQSMSAGLGSVALTQMLVQSGDIKVARGQGISQGQGIASGQDETSIASAPPVRAKHNIVLFMPGGPSQIDMFDPKPALKKFEGQRPPAADIRTERTTGGLLPSPFGFKQHGECGLEVSELLPNLAAIADDLCVVRSMYTFNPTHVPARNLMHSGNIGATRPTLGAWLDYGLGTENHDLPGFVVLSAGGGAKQARNGFLPAKHQGVGFDCAQTVPERMIPFLKNSHYDLRQQREQLDLIQQLNHKHADSFGGDTYLDGRINAMETAYRMQTVASEAFDLSNEPESIREEYGTTPYANGCLLARRLIERGVRSVHVHYGPGQDWDDHSKINQNLMKRCPDMDQASAALIRDLKRRGLLDETAVVWGGEFGRTPVSESSDGRDHNPYGFTMFMAGGGFKGGLCYGTTDELGFKAIDNRMSVHDLHATLLHVMGIDHEQLTYRYAGRDFRLTDVFGQVKHDLLT